MNRRTKGTVAPQGPHAPATAALLRGELARVKDIPAHEVLRVSRDAEASEVRSAYLAAAKRFHPHRFTSDPELRRLANRVFIAIHDAYTELAPHAHGSARQAAAPAPTPTPSSRMAVGTQAEASGPVRTRSTTNPTRPPSIRTRTGARTRTTSGRWLLTVSETGTGPDAIFREAVALCQRGAFARGRALFHRLATKSPQEKRYRIYLHYAWGKEHEADQRYDEALAEYQRALRLDPDFLLAKTALDGLRHAQAKPGGTLRRFFVRK